MVGFQLHGIPDWTALAGACPGKGSMTKLQTNFQTSSYTTILLGHSKIENTVRYLGVDVEDALVLAERIEI
jgi:hypothetical protein